MFNIHDNGKHYLRGKGKFNLVFLLLYSLFDVIMIPFFGRSGILTTRAHFSNFVFFFLALTGNIWYVSNGTLKNILSDLVARAPNCIKAVYHPIYVCQYDLKYLTINFKLQLLAHKFNCCVTSCSTNCASYKIQGTPFHVALVMKPWKNLPYVSLFESHALTFWNRNGEVGWGFWDFQSQADT